MAISHQVLIIADAPFVIYEIGAHLDRLGVDLIIPMDDDIPELLHRYLQEYSTIVIEGIVSDVALKRHVLERAAFSFDRTTPILTLTHTTSATQAASWCKYPERVVGFSALPPFANTTVVELMPALQSDPAMIEKAKRFWRDMEREPVTIADSVGGVVPRIVCNLINEAAYALMEGVATPADIDLAMQLGTNHPRGPLAWADLIGIPQVVSILEALGREFGTTQYHPAPLLKQYARAGRRFYE